MRPLFLLEDATGNKAREQDLEIEDIDNVCARVLMCYTRIPSLRAPGQRAR